MNTPASTATTRRRALTLDDLLVVRTPWNQHRIALSPDGRYLAFAARLEVQNADPPSGRFSSGAGGEVAGAQLWMTDIERGESWPLLGDEGRSWRPSWSPDGTHLAFYADHRGAVQLWSWQPAVGSVEVLSEQALFTPWQDTPRWSPDSSRVYVLLRPEGWQLEETDTPTASPGATDGPTVDVLVSPPPPSQDPKARANEASQRLCDVGIVDVRTGATERLSTEFGPMGVYPSLDGHWLAVVAQSSRPSLAQFQFMHPLYLMPAAGGAPCLVAKGLDRGGTGRHDPAWSPDSRHLAYVRDGRLWLAPANGGEPRQLPLDVELDVRFLLWHPAGKQLLGRDRGGRLWIIPTEGPGSQKARPLDLPEQRSRLCVMRRIESGRFWSPDGDTCVVGARDKATGRSEVWRVPLDGSSPERLLAEDRVLHVAPLGVIDSYFGDVSADGRTVVYAMEAETHPPDFWVTDPTFRERRRITHLNPHLDEVALGTTRLISWETVTGEQARGAVLLPANYRDGQRVPLITHVYPGSSLSNVLHDWDSYSGILHPQLLASRGYAVLMPDTPAKQLGVPDARLTTAVLLAVNEAVRLGIADPERLGVMGHSGGGAAVNRIITETTRFKAAVSAAGRSDAASFFGQLRLWPDGSPDMFGIHIEEGALGGPPWERPFDYVAASPIFFLDRVETPLLLIYGTEDDAVGVEQGGEMFVGLRRLEKEVTLLRYHGEGHFLTQYSEANRRDVVARVLAWFEQHLRP